MQPEADPMIPLTWCQDHLKETSKQFPDKERSQPSRYQRQSAKPTGMERIRHRHHSSDSLTRSFHQRNMTGWPGHSAAQPLLGIAAVSMRKRMIKVIPWLA
ncbi:hypothetical protein SRHO_G00052640 [Serrasalmus rhombeus]